MIIIKFKKKKNQIQNISFLDKFEQIFKSISFFKEDTNKVPLGLQIKVY